jgi:hypothetical protein
MKRMSILVLMVCVMSQQYAIARYRTPARSRVRYSMYAFGHKNSGLVSGYTKYSPQAFGINNSGLVHEWVRYDPYAFGHKHNGLISEFGTVPSRLWSSDNRDLNQQKLTKAIGRLSHSIDNIHSRRRPVFAANHGGGRARYATQTVNVDDLTSDNPRLLMNAFLKVLIPGQYKVSQLLRVDQEVVSFNVHIKNRDLIIKYWNPAKVQSIKEASNQKTEQLSDYMKAWAAAENSYEGSGERVVHIMSTDHDKIIVELANCLQTKTM